MFKTYKKVTVGKNINPNKMAIRYGGNHIKLSELRDLIAVQAYPQPAKQS